MTQPPSHQPPQGGFGAPQDTPPQQPSQGPPQDAVPQPPAAPPQPPQMPPTPPGQPNTAPAYGYPQTPPGAPGYGYPQQQQQPGPYNQQPGPYGQQPGPYGSQPGPYGQQPNPYGGGYLPQYPQQPQFPGPNNGANNGGGNGGKKGFFKGRPGVIVAAVVAGLLVIGGGTWFALSGNDKDDTPPVAHKSDDPKPTATASVDEGDGTGTGRGDASLNADRKPGDAKVLWVQTNDEDVPGDGSEAFGPWVVGDTVVKAMYKQIVGYSVTDGKKKWTLPLDQAVCSAPVSATADGQLVIATRENASDTADCNQMQLVDLKTGKGGWKKEVAASGLFDLMLSVSMTISGDTVTVSRTGHTDAYRVSDGKTLWGKIAGDCQPNAIAGGATLVAAETCPSADIDTYIGQVQGLDPLTGTARWTYKLPTGWQADKVLSVDPLVLSVHKQADSGSSTWAVLTLNQNGTLRSQLSGSKDQFWASDCQSLSIGDTSLEGCQGVAADADTLYMATKPAKSDLDTNEVVAFNLNTGKPKWRTKLPSRETLPLQMEGGNILAYVPATFGGKGGEVVTIAPTGGTPKVLQKHPDAGAKIESGFYNPKTAYVDGRFYLVDPLITGEGDDKKESAVKTMMAFGK